MNHLQTDHDALKHLEESLCQRWRCHCESFKRCKKKFSKTRVHNARVTTRRLISTLELLEPFVSRGKLRKAIKSLKDYLDNFDDLRDTQVHLARVGEMRNRFAAATRFHQWLEAREVRFTRKTRRTIKSFKTKGLARRVNALENEVRECHKKESPQLVFGKICRTLDEAFTSALELRKRIRADNPQTIHRTRVAFKYFRYMVEELSPLLPAATKKCCQAMRDYQSKMGDIQDAETLLAAFDEFLCRKKVDPVAAEKFRDNLKRRERRLIEIFLNSADDLNNFKL